jgi:hypothetical protein
MDILTLHLTNTGVKALFVEPACSFLNFVQWHFVFWWDMPNIYVLIQGGHFITRFEAAVCYKDIPYCSETWTGSASVSAASWCSIWGPVACRHSRILLRNADRLRAPSTPYFQCRILQQQVTNTFTACRCIIRPILVALINAILTVYVTKRLTLLWL